MEAKFLAKKKPLHEKRQKIIDGAELEELEETNIIFDKHHESLKTIAAGIEKTIEEQNDDAEEENKHEPTDVSYLKNEKGIPDYWVKCLDNNKLV
jgi:hypothetical protein